MSPIRLFIVDDHQLLIDAWTLIFSKHPSISVIGSSNNPLTAPASISELQPDIVLLDLSMQPIDGFALLPLIRKMGNAPLIIGVTMYNMPAYAKRLLQQGAQGYVTKNSPKDELVEAVLRVSAGQIYLCREIIEGINEAEFEQDKLSQALSRLSKRELEVIGYVRDGMHSRQIGEILHVKTKTIEVHRYNILRKLGLKNVAEMVHVFASRGL